VRNVVSRIVVLGFLFSCGVLGIAIMYVEPVSVLTCRYVEPKQVDCQIQERLAGVVPVRRIPIAGLENAYAKWETETRQDEDGDEYTVSVATVILVCSSGEVTVRGTGRPEFAGRTTKRINDFLNVPAGESLTVRHAAWGKMLPVTLAGGVLFGLSVYGSVVWGVHVLGFSQKARYLAARLRPKVRSAKGEDDVAS
jgi:hypothetical protein